MITPNTPAMSQSLMPLAIGARFSMHGSEFQVQTTAANMIRYASVRGGKSFTLSVSQFEQYVIEDRVKVTQNPNDIVINARNAKDILRKRRYIEAAIRTVQYLSCRKDLNRVISEVKISIGDENPPSSSSLIRWINVFKKQDIQGLIVKKPGKIRLRFEAVIFEIFWQAVEEVWLKRERREAQDVLDHIIGQLGSLGLADEHNAVIDIPHLRTIQRWLNQLDPILVIHAKHGPEAAKRAARASGAKILSPGPLTIVQIDTHYVNVQVVDPDSGDLLGRPYLVALTCIRTRKIVGIFVSLYPPCATTTLGAFKDMVINYGIPTLIYNDRGIEFINSAFQKVCDFLGVIVHTPPPRTPNARSHVESFFKTITHALYNKLPGTTFSNIDEKGDYQSCANAVFTLEQVESYTREWIDETYHRDPHSQTSLSPDTLWEKETALIAPQLMTADEIDVMARVPYTRTVSAGRVLVDYIYYYSHTLMLLNGESVEVLVDELDLNIVYVKHPHEKELFFSAESTDQEYTKGLTHNQHVAAREELEKLSKSEIDKLGKYATSFSRFKLLARIHNDQNIGRKWLKKIKNGQSNNDLLDQNPSADNFRASKTNNQLRIENAANTSVPEVISDHSQNATDNAEDIEDSYATYSLDEENNNE